MPDGVPIILASGSAARRQMLESAGVTFAVLPASVDEDALRRDLLAREPAAAPSDIALALATAKARAVSEVRPEALVIGGDQVLAFAGELFDKPGSVERARVHLLRLRGATHELHAAVALARGGTVSWRCAQAARMSMRPFSDAFLDRYLADCGPAVARSVGAYHLEGLGIQLFSSIDGDFFTVLGMPLLPLIAALRKEGALAT
jgi:septum formation protein